MEITRVFGDPTLLDRELRQMQIAPSLRRNGDQHAHHGGVSPFQFVEPEFGRRIGVLQWIDQFLGRIIIRRWRGDGPFSQQSEHVVLLNLIVWRLGRRPLLLAQQIVHQGQPAARGDRQYLVQTIGIEGREHGFGWLVAMQREADLAALVPDDEFAAG
jgi:hypothetical protein